MSGLLADKISELHNALGKENEQYIANRVIQLLRTLFNWASRPAYEPNLGQAVPCQNTECV
jgi:hypothetical protein